MRAVSVKFLTEFHALYAFWRCNTDFDAYFWPPQTFFHEAYPPRAYRGIWPKRSFVGYNFGGNGRIATIQIALKLDSRLEFGK